MPEIKSMGDDAATVRKAVASPRIKEIQAKILNGAATEDEIEQHYRTFDAIDIPKVPKNRRSLYVQGKMAGRIALADFMGGAQMMSKALFEPALEANGGYDDVVSGIVSPAVDLLVENRYMEGRMLDRDIDRWDSVLNLLDYTTPPNPTIKALGERVGLLQAAHVAGIFTEGVTAASTEQLHALSLGRIVMREGTKGFRHIVDLYPREFTPTRRDAHAMNLFIDIAESPELQIGVTDFILRSAQELEQPEAKEIFLTELKRSIGPMLSWQTAGEGRHTSKYLGQDYSIAASAIWGMQDETFGDAMYNMNILTQYARETNPDMFKKGRIKGSLHEALWMLDAFVLRRGMREQYGNYSVNVATDAEDMPFLDHPSMKRGYDFVVQDETTGARRLIQVGASRQKLNTNAVYHPGIEVRCEQSFNEVNITTLEKKLRAYTKWAEGGYKKQDFDALRIKDLLLGTVKDVFQVE